MATKAGKRQKQPLQKDARNKFCKLADLGNEATVEQFFTNRLLKDLGYKDAQIRPKAALDELTIFKGSKKLKWRPDYALLYNGRVRWICDAKGVEEDLDEWVGQCSSYCLELNKTIENGNPVECFMLTNGVTTRVYRWDSDKPVLEVDFHHFVDGNVKYQELHDFLSPSAFKKKKVSENGEAPTLTLTRRSVNELNQDFAWAHRTIYKRENLSYTAAFMEFVKVIFLKLWSDRQVHASNDLVQISEDSVRVLASEVRFSRRWIADREQDTPSPLDAILFQKLLSEFEKEINEGRKKRIFDKGETLGLSPETLKLLVERLETVDLISIDADLNGRMFEVFLNSALRGKALGQYFTPRSVVRLATGLADLQANPDHVDRVIDACCGTGGFLIEALAEMWHSIDANTSLSNSDKEELRTRVATESLIGVDVARDPALARIARINMYLHGDGGSSIYQLDALDKKVLSAATDPPEIAKEKKEFSGRIKSGKNRGIADVALTNPPFAKEYRRAEESDSRLLDDYELGFATTGGQRRPIAKLSSMVMFLERYHDLLATNGRLVTVVDDGVLGAASHKRVRDWIRKNWIVKAVISLPGDAFQRSQARVKTSVLILKKKEPGEEQPDVFMYYCTAVGIDDAPRQRILPIDELNRQRAVEEIATVTWLYRAFLLGKEGTEAWTVSASAISDRMDVKACLPSSGSRVDDWKKAGFETVKLASLVQPVAAENDESDRFFDTESTDELVTYLRVKYDGFCQAGEEVATSDLTKQQLTRVKSGDLVFSHINAIHGAVGVVPKELEGLVVTSEYTVCQTIGTLSASTIWSLLRSGEARADMVLTSTGIGRTRVNWEILSELVLPIPPKDLQSEIEKAIQEAENAEKRRRELLSSVQNTVGTKVLLDSERAQQIIAAFKPPR